MLEVVATIAISTCTDQFLGLPPIRLYLSQDTAIREIIEIELRYRVITGKKRI